MSVYSFSTSPNFTSDTNITSINSAIDGSTISQSRTDTSVIGDTIIITFSDVLNSNDITLLNNIIVSIDVFVPPYGDKIFSVYPNATISSTSYQLLFKIPFKNWNITHIEINSYMDSPLTNYIIRIFNPYDASNLFESTLTNVTDFTTTISSFSTIPSGIPHLEFHCKVTNTTSTQFFAYINSVVIYYTL